MLDEQSYDLGWKAAWERIFMESLRQIDHPTEGRSREALILERSAAIGILRQVCADHGDNDWDNDLHLSDILEKHLACYLDRPTTEKEA